MSISFCYIVRDNEQIIEKSLKSVKDIADEIIVVDTGSKDRTKEIVKNYTDYIFDFKWCDDFSLARNFAISKCTKDFIFIIDSDERLDEENRKRTKNLLNNGKIEGFSGFLIKQCSDEFSVWTPRIFKNGKVKYKYMIHEEPVLLDYGKYAKTNIKLLHNGYEAKMIAKKVEKNLNLHLKQLIKEPTNPNVRFYLARCYFKLKRYKEAVENAIVSLICKEIDNDKKAQLCLILFMIFNECNNFYIGIEFLEQSLRLIPKQIYSRWILSSIYYEKKLYDKSLNELKIIKDIIEKDNSELSCDLKIDIDDLQNKINIISKLN